MYPGDSASVVGTQLQNLIAVFGSFAGWLPAHCSIEAVGV
jgi:hypothetical protein